MEKKSKNIWIYAYWNLALQIHFWIGKLTRFK